MELSEYITQTLAKMNGVETFAIDFELSLDQHGDVVDDGTNFIKFKIIVDPTEEIK